jgi:hypothetical protein
VRCDPTLRDHAPDGPAWLHEIKIDGCRAQVHIHHGPISVYSGSGYNRPTTAARSCRSWRRNGCFDDRFGMALFPFRSGGILGHGSTVCSCFARYLDFAWRAFAAHSLDAQAKLFSLAVVGGLACELLHHSATLEPAARGHLKDVSKRTASPFPRAVRWTRAEDPLTNSISECEPDDQSDCNFQHHRGLGFTRTPPEHLKLKGGVSGTSSFCTCP